MNPMLFPILIGGLVIAMVTLLFLAFRRNAEGAVSDRLDSLVGRNVRRDSSADLLLKQALQEADKKSVLDRLTPEFFNLTKTFEQADCNIKPSALFGISLRLERPRRGHVHLARERLRDSDRRDALLQPSVALALSQASDSAQEVCGPAPRRDGTRRPRPAGRALTRGRHARRRRGNARRRSARNSAGFTRNRTWAFHSRRP